MVRLDWGKKREYNKKARIGAEQGENTKGRKPDHQGSKRPGVKRCIPAERQLETDNTVKAFTGP